MKPTGGKIELSDEQKEVYRAVLERRNVLVTGSAGTGKSTLLEALRAKFRDMIVTASTGIAAVNVFGRTVHSWSGVNTMKPIESVLEEVIRRKQYASRIKRAKILAVDEISMLDVSMLDSMDHIFRTIRGSDKPFGGIQMIFFGDFLQLPPVKGTGFAFESSAWKKADIKTFHLTHVFRQKDREFSSILNQIRIGEITPEVAAFLTSRKGLKPNKKIKPVVVHTHNDDVDKENAWALSKLKGEPHQWTAKDFGEEGPLKNIQRNCLAPEVLTLKVGAQVMCLWNIAPEDGIANGSIGIVTEIDGDTPIVQFENGLIHEFERKTWECRDGEKFLAGRSQMPLRLAYSITVHKSQGMTLDAIEVSLEKCFSAGQAYVALSRCRTVDGLFIKSLNLLGIYADPHALDFYGH